MNQLVQNILFVPCFGDNNLACQIPGTPNDCTAAPMFGNSRSLGEEGMRSFYCPIIVKVMKKKTFLFMVKGGGQLIDTGKWTFMLNFPVSRHFKINCCGGCISTAFLHKQFKSVLGFFLFERMQFFVLYKYNSFLIKVYKIFVVCLFPLYI